MNPLQKELDHTLPIFKTIGRVEKLGLFRRNITDVPIEKQPRSDKGIPHDNYILAHLAPHLGTTDFLRTIILQVSAQVLENNVVYSKEFWIAIKQMADQQLQTKRYFENMGLIEKEIG